MTEHFDLPDDPRYIHGPAHETSDVLNSSKEKNKHHFTFAEMVDRVEFEYPVNPDHLLDVMKDSLGGRDPKIYFYTIRQDSDTPGALIIESDLRVRVKNSLDPEDIMNVYVVLVPMLDPKGITIYVPLTWYQEAGMAEPPSHEFIDHVDN